MAGLHGCDKVAVSVVVLFRGVGLVAQVNYNAQCPGGIGCHYSAMLSLLRILHKSFSISKTEMRVMFLMHRREDYPTDKFGFVINI